MFQDQRGSEGVQVNAKSMCLNIKLDIVSRCLALGCRTICCVGDVLQTRIQFWNMPPRYSHSSSHCKYQGTHSISSFMNVADSMNTSHER